MSFIATNIINSIGDNLTGRKTGKIMIITRNFLISIYLTRPVKSAQHFLFLYIQAQYRITILQKGRFVSLYYLELIITAGYICLHRFFFCQLTPTYSGLCQ